MVFALDPSVFGSITSKSEYDRQKQQLKQQKQMQDLKMMALQKQAMAQPEMDLNMVLGKAQQVGFENLTPQEQRLVIGSDISQMAKQTVDARGNVITNRSLRDLLGQPPAQVMGSPVDVMDGWRTQGIAPEVDQPQISSFPDVASGQQYEDIGMLPPVMQEPYAQVPQGVPSLPMPDVSGLSPYGAEDIRKEAMKEQIKLQAEQQKKIGETGKAKEGVTQTVGDMVEQYRKLQGLGGITSTARSPLENIRITATETNPLAQTIQKAAGSETQTARQVIEASRARLMQEVKKATGMSAQEVNSIPEMQLLKESISDPTMTVEAVEKILGNIESKYGLGKGVSIKDQPAIRTYNPATGRLE